ncbi:hypothetical protein D3C85_1130410 [compost metagenome]
MHAQRNIGMRAREFKQHRRQIQMTQARRQPDAHVSPDSAVQAIDGGLHRAHLVQQADAVLIQQLAGLRQLDMPRGSPEKLRAQVQLKALEPM